MKSLVALLFLAVAGPAAAQAQDPPRDPLKDFKIGDRIELILRNGFSIMGEIIAVDPKTTDVTKMKVITLDVGWEYPELKGHIGVERIHVKAARRLPHLGDKEVKAREKARQDALKRMEAEDNSRRALIAARDLEAEEERKAAEKKEQAEKLKGLGKDLEAKAEMLKKGAELHAKYPESAGWGVEKMKAIGMKTITQVPATTDERDFMQNYETWVKYKAYLEEQKTKEKENEAVEGVKKEPAPAPAPKPEEAPKQ
ncbi:MAG TPA: hypothetical protein VFC90_05540 [Planctomycetota bacterium]|nr:hypothetical protein [Planctomycetota bacterium]